MKKRLSQNDLRLQTASALLGYATLAMVGVACGGGDKALKGSKSSTTILKQCKASGHRVTEVDVNNDKRADVRHFFKETKRVCSKFDMNFDGVADATRYYSPVTGQPVREYDDFDFDGKTDQIVFFEKGKLARKELDTNFDMSIDTWMWCDGAYVVKVERDRNRDGKADAWEHYAKGKLAQASYDDNNNTKPERWERYRDGRLVEVHEDLDNDGTVDRKEAVRVEDAGPEVASLMCETPASDTKKAEATRGKAGAAQ